MSADKSDPYLPTAMLRALCLTALLNLVAPSRSLAATDGIFADFSTSLGTFSCELHHRDTPRTVASFVGLATGNRPWVDPNAGTVQTHPFFDGLTFHRVIGGFMNQCGSPNGQGTDGPGYVFPDEFNPALRHDGPGVLSMANSGPHSNGSQFFVTVTNTPHLDDRHTVFGRVIDGLDTVNAINSVLTDAEDRPLVPVILQSVVIRRVGPAAESFDIHAHPLPVVSAQGLGIRTTADQAVLTFTPEPFADLRLSESPDLRSWNMTQLGIDFRPPAPREISRPLEPAVGFFSLTRIQYPDSTRAPGSLRNSILTVEFAENQGTLVITFDGEGRGTYHYEGSSGSVESYTWIQEVYRGRLWPVFFSGIYPMTLRLDFASNTSGTLVGTVHPPSPFPPSAATGRFTLATP